MSLFSPLTTTMLTLLTPPAINCVFLLIGLAMAKKWKSVGLGIASLSVISLFLISLPAISSYLAATPSSLEALNTESLKNLQKTRSESRAILVLSGGRSSKNSEYGEIDTINAITLERLRYSAWLSKKISSPIMLSGGSKRNEATSEAVLMNQVMMSSFGTAPRWIESNSTNLLESAQFSSLLLNKAQITEVILVTHASEMPLALGAFKSLGLKIVPAPIGFVDGQQHHAPAWLPNSNAFHLSATAIHLKLTLWLLDLTQ